MPQVTLTDSVQHDGKDCAAGDVLDVTEEQAVALVQAGVAQLGEGVTLTQPDGFPQAPPVTAEVTTPASPLVEEPSKPVEPAPVEPTSIPVVTPDEEPVAPEAGQPSPEDISKTLDSLQ